MRIATSLGIATCDTFIYLVRHGETTANRDKIRQGHCDYPLTEQGVNGALLAGDLLKDIPFDGILTSDLGRAARTCELIVSRSRKCQPNIIIQSNVLREISFGIREELHVDTTMDEARRIVAAKQGIAPEDVDDLAETDDSLLQRHRGLLELIRSTYTRPQQHVLCVTHGGFIRSLLRNLIPGTQDQKIENCGLTVVRAQWDNNGELQTLSLLPTYYNFIDHLLRPDSFEFNTPVF